MTTDPQARTSDADVLLRATDVTKHYRLRGDSPSRTAGCCGLPARERGPARTAHSAPDTFDRKAAP
ncbi:hypothetical protein [Streptomyces sp. GQFP]|uniref:hypothetical protein n=1 Tax=Streptomyces sp. GQFP TaxID=2907545 RepID=UPI001F3E5858|nr:hypothetical protein [Streptomyces sp. GQFP]UIX29081.1 hypothetical protein LUX31_03060 [Streptomyces sp. GQFP]